MIKIQNLSKNFIHLNVLKKVTAEVVRGEVVAILGPSGSGKSTLLRCLNLLEKPTEGQIFINQNDITNSACNIALIRQKIGMVFQQFNLFPHMTVMENLIYAPCQVLKESRQSAIVKAKELLKKVGLLNKASAYPTQLSGGQKQRVAIARALAMEPEVILFDEPTSALDPEMVKEVLEVIKDLAQQKMTMVIVTHEMGFAREAADHIWFLDDGELLEVSTPKEFFKKPKTQRAQQFLEKVL
ncbi:MAG: amino acid ABC transporter ATP-binding protein [Candidatus Paracaedimonas acanthamoebae]|uniref:Amino acid ABC transporter ATP-binding protein n=1 Tax=Candidatus Paracaedimonas acanthamoebae TaxID=244581 RepID=A0A8J7PVS2_9PROT|nr:amino acid ABC transporter ATP-binding protein [Candidatus Paracaedimonas acanthamoebae]